MELEGSRIRGRPTAFMAPMVRHNLAFLVNKVAQGGDRACGFNHSGKPGVTKFRVKSQSANGGLQDADAREAGNTS
jgi:hypothetical protein